MIRTVATALALLFVTPALAIPVDALGKWTMVKGKCADEENIVRITPKSVKAYEDQCKIVREEATGKTDTYYKLSASCDAEGESYKKVMYIYSPSAPNELPVMLGVEGLGQRLLHRCAK